MSGFQTHYFYRIVSILCKAVAKRRRYSSLRRASPCQASPRAKRRRVLEKWTIFGGRQKPWTAVLGNTWQTKVCIFCFLPKILQIRSPLQARYSGPGEDWDKAWYPSLVRYHIGEHYRYWITLRKVSMDLLYFKVSWERIMWYRKKLHWAGWKFFHVSSVDISSKVWVLLISAVSYGKKLKQNMSIT